MTAPGAAAARAAAKRCLLTSNEFWTLRVNVRNTAAEIVAAASSPLLDGDADMLTRARLALVNPRARIECEIGWLPGVSPNRAKQLVDRLIEAPGALEDDAGIPAMAAANLAVSRLQLAPVPRDEQRATDALLAVLRAIDEVKPEALIREINEDRSISAFAAVRSIDQLKNSLQEHKRRYRAALRDFLNQLPAEVIIRSLTEVVSTLTEGGTRHGGDALDALIDVHDLEIRQYLDGEAASARRIQTAMLEHAQKGDHHLAPSADRLAQLLTNWRMVTLPIQMHAKSRGQVHLPSQDLAATTRGFTIDLVNDHGCLGAASKLNSALQSSFPELPEFMEVVETDRDTLESMLQAKETYTAAESELSYAAFIGIFATRFSIDSGEIVWGKLRIPAKDVDRFRWSATRHFTNGIQTGTTYAIQYGAGRLLAHISSRNEKVFKEIIDRLWRIVGTRLAEEMLHKLSKGGRITIGGINFVDAAVALPIKTKGSKKEYKWLSWDEVSIYPNNGKLFISKSDDKSCTAWASYQEHDNTHVMENLLGYLKRKNLNRISDILRN